jgi:methionine-rich copper-binding protein CopC
MGVATEMFRPRLRLAAVPAAAAVFLVCATVALAHVTLVSTSPAKNATLAHAPRSVSLLFSGPIRSGTLTVVDAHGRTASTGRGGRDPRNIKRLLVALRAGLGSGRYTAHGSSLAADGHRQTWTYSFTVRK